MCNFPFWIKKDYGSEPVLVPCGMCTSCRIEKSRQWAVRICHEASLHDKNCFATLTYNKQNLPKDESLKREHVQKFMKRLRRYIEPKKVRFYACGEYGSKLGRPHYHICLFGYDDEKKEKFEKVYSKYSRENWLYISPTLEHIWKKGFVKIGEISLESASYVAKYVVKRITGDMALEHYKGKTPEFALMSRRPGIGKGWIEKYLGDVYPKDYFHINGIRSRAPRFYDEYLKKVDCLTHEAIKIKRKEEQYIDHPIRQREKEKYQNLMHKLKERRLENE